MRRQGSGGRVRGAPLLVLLLLAASAAPASGQAVVLIHHSRDDVDPFGVALRQGDSFSARYAHVAAGAGRFDYPTFVADGLNPIVALPVPAQPYAGTLDAYAAGFAARAAAPAGATLAVQAIPDGKEVRVEVGVAPGQGLEPVRLWVAITEDHVRYIADSAISNGVEDHRFTVRAIVDGGLVEGPANRTFRLLAGDWDPDFVSAAAWLQAEPNAVRLAPHEAVQAASAKLGAPATVQASKAVLLELYSATWCDPCLYGDLAMEELAVRHAGASKEAPPAKGYYRAPDSVLVFAVAAVGGLAFALVGRRR
ncbi:MAG: hypothetical protein QOD77_507 [Thermoplasmata archaeon]|jgi:hypothetical protein|nr:hypothetical protein [Thermoplasmata archaeon]